MNTEYLNSHETTPETFFTDTMYISSFNIMEDCYLPLEERCKIAAQKLKDMFEYCNTRDRTERLVHYGYGPEHDNFIFFGPDFGDSYESYYQFLKQLVEDYFYWKISSEFQLPIVLWLEQNYSFQAVKNRFLSKPFQNNQAAYEDYYSPELLAHWGLFHEIPFFGDEVGPAYDNAPLTEH